MYLVKLAPGIVTIFDWSVFILEITTDQFCHQRRHSREHFRLMIQRIFEPRKFSSIKVSKDEFGVPRYFRRGVF